MVRKRERVIGTLLIWISLLLAMSTIFNRLIYPPIHLQNTWYYAGNVVTGASSEEALQILNDLQQVGTNVYNQMQQLTQGVMLTYMPWLLLISAALLLGGVLSTMFIWRSVIVPEATSEKIAARRSENQADEAQQSLASLLDDDGEISTEDEPQVGQSHKGK